MSLMNAAGCCCNSCSCNCSTCSPSMPSSVSVTFSTITLSPSSLVWCCQGGNYINTNFTNSTVVLNKCTCTSTEAIYWGSQLIHTGYIYEGSYLPSTVCDNSLCLCNKTVNELKFYLVSRLVFNCDINPCDSFWELQSYILKVGRYSHDVSCGSRPDCLTNYPYCTYAPLPTGNPFNFDCSVNNSFAAVSAWASTYAATIENSYDTSVPLNLQKFNNACNILGEYSTSPYSVLIT